jgi:hypothetical protein
MTGYFAVTRPFLDYSAVNITAPANSTEAAITFLPNVQWLAVLDTVAFGDYFHICIVAKD